MTAEISKNDLQDDFIDLPQALQLTITENIYMLKRRTKVKQEVLAKALHISQSTLSQKFSGQVRWSISDLAYAADFFEVSAAWLISNNFISPDNSRRELAGATPGARFFVEPDDGENEGTAGGNARPRFFVMCPLRDSNPGHAD